VSLNHDNAVIIISFFILGDADLGVTA